MEKLKKKTGSAEFRAVSFCVGTLQWPTRCSGVGVGIGFEGTSSGSAVNCKLVYDLKMAKHG